MKKLASIMLTAAMILSLTGCGENAESSSVPDSGETQTSTSAPETTPAETTAATTTEATTTTADTTVSEPEETDVPVEDETPDEDEKPAVSNDYITLGEAVDYRIKSAIGDSVILEESSYLFVANTDGEPFNDKTYSMFEEGFDDHGMALLREEYTSYIGQPATVVDKEGNELYYNALDCADGIVVTREEALTYTHPIFNHDAILYKFNFIDVETGEIIYCFDEVEQYPYLDEHTANYEFMEFYGDYCVLYSRYTVGAVGFKDIYVISKDGELIAVHDNINPDALLQAALGESVSISSFWLTNGGMIFCVSGADTNEEYSVVYDIENATFTKTDSKYTEIHYADFENNIIALKSSSGIDILDAQLNVKVEGLKGADTSGCEKYLKVYNGEKRGFYIIESEEFIWFDEVTKFINGYAFVIVNGEGHFVNEALETVSESYPAQAINAYFDGFINIKQSMFTHNTYPINYPTAE